MSPVTPNVGKIPLDSSVMETYGYLIEQLSNFNLAYLHFVEGATGGSRNIPADVYLDALRAKFKGPYIGNNSYDLDLALQRRAQGKVDVVAFGRYFISNPDLVHRLKNGLELAIAPRESYYNGGAKGYTDWPTADL